MDFQDQRPWWCSFVRFCMFLGAIGVAGQRQTGYSKGMNQGVERSLSDKGSSVVSILEKENPKEGMEGSDRDSCRFHTQRRDQTLGIDPLGGGNYRNPWKNILPSYRQRRPERETELCQPDMRDMALTRRCYSRLRSTTATDLLRHGFRHNNRAQRRGTAFHEESIKLQNMLHMPDS